ncbi:transposase [Actinoplanes sp. NBRC 103695]|uniref:transposase n=1 Tax=Actinoplanes sp. NBRC 103695 TaxID=3032202 RepID=UPI00332ADFF8
MKICLVRWYVVKPWIVDDQLWELLEPLLPPRPVKAPGPRPVPDRQCLQGILYVLRTGIGWERPSAGARLRVGHDVLAADQAVDRRRCVR